ncbi:OmpA family protein [Gilvimarinus agarilyticus]|uniref:OmpA family protein n=1 Tax=Gilvimarinus agarilyticus TaxID=679259 RepID=UPI00059F48F6|nr:OmpA family protein [Gilvimarinus agarilyticus]
MKFFPVALTTLSATLLLSSAQAEEADHPLVSAYSNAEIRTQINAHYTESYIALSKLNEDGNIEKKSVIGKQTAHIYELKGGRSPLEVAENYLQAIDNLDGEVLLHCYTDDPCGQKFSYRVTDPTWVDGAFVNLRTFSQGSNNYHFIAAQAGPKSNPTYLQWIIVEKHSGRVSIGQLITEPETLLLDQVTVKKDSIREFSEPSVASQHYREDADGQDHPLISRYQGARITKYSETDFSEVLLATGIADENGDVPHLALEGKSTFIAYETLKDQSTLQVFSNYQHALKKSGFDILFECERAECGDEQIENLWRGSAERGRFTSVIDTDARKDDDYRMLTAKKKSGNGEVFLSVMISKESVYKGVEIVHDIVESAQMTTDRVSINTTYLTDSLAREGKVVLHGLNFASGKADILPSSQPALDVILSYLQSAPEQQFYVVGHTDTTGEHTFNMQLSKDRAESIRATLVEQGVAETRLLAAGVGAMTPISTNASENGRAYNRRVELVLR